MTGGSQHPSSTSKWIVLHMLQVCRIPHAFTLHSIGYCVECGEKYSERREKKTAGRIHTLESSVEISVGLCMEHLHRDSKEQKVIFFDKL